MDITAAGSFGNHSLQQNFIRTTRAVFFRLFMPVVYMLPLLLFSALPLHTMTVPAGAPVYDGPELDYQPSVIRLQPAGSLIMVYERLNASTLFGDLLVTFSSDDGLTWTVPQPAVAGARNERHPGLVQLLDETLLLLYLVDETGSGAYRIHRARSADGVTWTEQGALELGWGSPGEINPSVIRETDGSLTMTYHRLGGPAYLARSSDSGATWDTLMTRVSDGTAALPRLAKRESDGLYLVTFQTGGSNVDLWARVSTDPYDWSDPVIPFSTEINSHDSQPMILVDDRFLVTYAMQAGSVFDLYMKTSDDGIVWSDAVRITTDTSHYDTQPHPIRGSSVGRILLAWSHQESSQPYVDHDVWVDPDLPVPPPANSQSILVTGPGPGQDNDSLVRVFSALDPDTILAEWWAHGENSEFGVNVAFADLDGDGLHEVLTGPGPGVSYGPHVRGFSDTGIRMNEISFLAYGTHKYGVRVAAGDLDGDNIDEILTGPGPGKVFGPHVRGFNYDGLIVQPLPGVSFLAYGTTKYGVRAVAGDVDGDGFDEIITAPGPGPMFGPHIRGFDINGTGTAEPMPGINFFAYGTPRYGATVACGDLDGDGRDEIVTGAGPGTVFGPHVRGWGYDGSATTPLPGLSFLAYGTPKYGVTVSCGDLDGDGAAEIITVAGPGPSFGCHVRGWSWDGAVVSALPDIDFFAYDPAEYLHGGSVSAGVR